MHERQIKAGRYQYSIANYMWGGLANTARGRDVPQDVAFEAIGRLCEVLARKGLLSAREISYIANDYDDEDVEFIPGTINGGEGA